MKISRLVAALEQAQAQHGDIDVLVLDEDLGEWRDTLEVTVTTGAVWRDGVPIITAVNIDADYDG